MKLVYTFTDSPLSDDEAIEIQYEIPHGMTLRVTDSEYVHPNSSVLRAILDDAGLTQSEAAEMLAVTERTMRNWLSPTHDAQISYTAWRTILHELGIFGCVGVEEPVAKNWWVLNQSPVAEFSDKQHHEGPFSSYRTAHNRAAELNQKSFDCFQMPDQYLDISGLTYEDLLTMWLESDADIYNVVHERDLPKD